MLLYTIRYYTITYHSIIYYDRLDYIIMYDNYTILYSGHGDPRGVRLRQEPRRLRAGALRPRLLQRLRALRESPCALRGPPRAGHAGAQRQPPVEGGLIYIYIYVYVHTYIQTYIHICM